MKRDLKQGKGMKGIGMEMVKIAVLFVMIALLLHGAA